MSPYLRSAAFRRDYPFRSRYLAVGGHRLHYVDEGAGEPVVMVHGNPTWSFYFRRLVQALAPTRRVIAPDHIGCGLSDAPRPEEYGYRLADRVADLDALLGHAVPEGKLSFLVHDWGGMIGLSWAARHPERIHRIIVTNTAAFLKPAGKPLPMRLRLIRDLAPFAVPAVLGLNLFANAALVMAPGKPLTPEARRGLTGPYDSPRRRRATLEFVRDIPLEPGDPSYEMARTTDDLLNRLAHVPMRILWGRHDFVFDMDYLAEWRRRFPDAQVTVFDRGGHYLLEDEPGAVIAAVKDFLKNPAPCGNTITI